MTGSKRYRAAAAAILVSSLILAGGCGGKRPPAGAAGAELEKAAIANSRGVRAYNSGRYERASGLFAESLRINRSLDNRVPEVVDLINLGRTHASMNDLPAAYGYLDEAASLAGATGDERLLSEVYATRARVEYISGDHAAALVHIDRSLSMDAEAGYDDTGGKLNLKGFLLMASGDDAEARKTLELALSLNAEHGHSSEEANSLRALAAISSGSGELDEARAYLESADEIDRGEGNPGRIAVDLEEMAAVELKAGRTKQAVFLLERSYQVNLSAGLKERALKDLELIISTLDSTGDTGALDGYTVRKEALVKDIEER